MIWLCGFVLISISFNASTQILPSSSIKEQIKKLTSILRPIVTIFAAARPFIGSIGSRESFVVRSWVGVSQDIRVVLSSQDPYGFSFADSLGLILGFMLDPTLITHKHLSIHLKVQ